MRKLFIKTSLIVAIAVFAGEAAARNVQWISPTTPAAGAHDHNGEIKTALVVSDEAARIVIDLFSSAADSVDDATQGNSREEENGSDAGVKVESVEDLDIKTERPAKKRRQLDENR